MSKDSYPKAPVAVLFTRTAKEGEPLHLRVFHNKTIDDILDPTVKLHGIPSTAVFVHVGVGETTVERFKEILAGNTPKPARKTAAPPPAKSTKMRNYHKKTKR